MGIVNSWVYSKSLFDWAKFEKATHNQYRVVASRLYTDKKGRLPDGITLTLTILRDDYDYGIDKNGQQRDNNLYQNFDVTVLNRNHAVKKGDVVQLLGYDEEHSYVIGYDFLLRFKDLKVLQSQQGGRPNAQTTG